MHQQREFQDALLQSGRAPGEGVALLENAVREEVDVFIRAAWEITDRE